ncbi:hypothetical protein HYC85_024442 [Camellia sinensis]|uniref:Cytokinin dehydrogenase 1 FAD/cytokinin binding domain-containing protein n=1 Tax=Camellia sinensis TaxID=4442 RepID=A0A7J7GCB5_CAMSI|nr:hypothetical protein HYC85_024442 [Camellia sinensis]
MQGQAQAHRGVVINMESFSGMEMQVYIGKHPYVDVYGGKLWINILHESLKHGLAPKSWIDYLHLIAFRHGLQISNVHQLEAVTGKGEVVNCSKKQNANLFHGVLGGLGQFGIITRARISLEPAPKMFHNTMPFRTGKMDKSFVLRLLRIHQRPGAFDIYREHEIENLSQLSYISSTLFVLEVSYVEFLDRAHVSEIKRLVGSSTPMAQSFRS